MVNIDTDEWIKRSKKRKLYRDFKREQFFSNLGIQKGATEKDFVLSSAEQYETIFHLIEISQTNWSSTHGNFAATLLSNELKSLGLGLFGMGLDNRLVDDMDNYSYKNLKSFFTSSFS